MEFDLADALPASCQTRAYSGTLEVDTECVRRERKDGPEMEPCLLTKDLSLDVELIPYRSGGMKKVAHLVIALRKLKGTFQGSHPTHSLGSKCTGDIQNITDNLFEEHMMEQNQDCVETLGNTFEGKFQRSDSIHECSLIDNEKKSLVHYSETMTLSAATLQGGNGHLTAKFKLSRYRYTSISSVPGQPVVLGIATTNLYLSCSMPTDNNTPVLLLEPCDAHQLSTITTDADKRFLFYKSHAGNTQNLATFESVKYRNWFISTSVEQQQLVEMCQKHAAKKLTIFRLEK